MPNSMMFFLNCYRELDNAEATLEAMLGGRVNALPGHIQAVYVQNILKVVTVLLTKSTVEQSILVRFNFTISYFVVRKICL